MEELRLDWVAPKLEELLFESTETGDVYPFEIATTAGPS